jgi:hypothetical protein
MHVTLPNASFRLQAFSVGPYLEGLVCNRSDTPSVSMLDVQFFNQPAFAVLYFFPFRVGVNTPCACGSCAEILFDKHYSPCISYTIVPATTATSSHSTPAPAATSVTESPADCNGHATCAQWMPQHGCKRELSGIVLPIGGSGSLGIGGGVAGAGTGTGTAGCTAG